MFRLMPYALAEKSFQSFEDMKKWVDSSVASKDEEFFRNEIRKLTVKWRNFIASDGLYFQKHVSSFWFKINAFLNKNKNKKLIQVPNR